MKIAYVSGSIIPSRYANSVQVVKMCQAFVNLGHEVTLYAIPGDNVSLDLIKSYYGVRGGFEIRFIRRPDIRLVGSMIYARAVARALQNDSSVELVYGRHAVALLAVANRNLPLVYEAHQLPQSHLQFMVQKLLFRRESFARLVTISEALRNDYVRRFPSLDPTRIIVAHDGADIPSRQVEGALDWPGRKDAIQVGYVGHLYPGKGMEVVIRVAEKLPDMDFHVIGGMEEDINYWRSVTNASNVYYHGFVRPSDLSQYYSRLDIVLAPLQRRVALHGGKGDISRWTSPLKIFEYMAYGKTIVVSDLPVLREVMKHEHNSLVVPPDDVDAWVAALVRLARNPRERLRLGEQARKDLESQFTWEVRARKVLAGL